MVIMAGTVFWLVRALLALVPALALRYPIKKWAPPLRSPPQPSILPLSGAAVPTARSWIMTSIVLIAVMLDRPARHMTRKGAVEEDCRIADIVIAPFTIGQRCRAARVIVDRRVLRTQGAHALYIEGLSIRTETVAASRGHRPWVPDRTVVEGDTARSAGTLRRRRRGRRSRQEPRRQSRRVTEGPPNSGGSGRPDVPARAPGRGRRCASRKRDWRLRARWSRLCGASA